jgi:hypothetical protein
LLRTAFMDLEITQAPAGTLWIKRSRQGNLKRVAELQGFGRLGLVSSG